MRRDASDKGMRHAVIVGSGPNGLSAAVALARAGVRVTVFEAAETIGGAVRTEALTLPGFLHDAGAAVFPLGIASPFLRTLPLHEHGLQWIEPDVPLAHPLLDGDCVAQMHDLDATAALLGPDGDAWRSLMSPLVKVWPALVSDAMVPLLHVPAHPFLMARFGLTALLSATRAAGTNFKTERARTLFAGLAGHSNVPLHFPASAAPALVLAAAAHATGWPIARDGAQSITNALASLLQSLGGVIHTGSRIGTLQELPPHDVVLLDVTARQFVRIAGDGLSESQREPYERVRLSPGVFKLDWALSAPIPWRAELARRAGTIHLGASFEEIATSEISAWEGRECEKPYVLLSQPSLFDSTRAPAGKHTAWAYCHVPNGSAADYTARIEAQVERFAPGFCETILARHTRTAPAMETWNANLSGGDISGGAMTLPQMIRRPTLPPYRTPVDGVYLCSSATPPGGGVHGMCGWFAASAAAKHMGITIASLKQ
jgi:phytoene dehydrogenase-like protein